MVATSVMMPNPLSSVVETVNETGRHDQQSRFLLCHSRAKRRIPDSPMHKSLHPAEHSLAHPAFSEIDPWLKVRRCADKDPGFFAAL
jgi:hypothetical protein